jgi:tryptophan-rich sensory protein
MSTATRTGLDLSRDDLPGLALAIILCEVVGAAPAFVTNQQLSTWYVTLTRPALAPPNWVFGPVWTLLFALLGVAAYLVYRDATGTLRRTALGAFVAQYAFNVSWTLVFFGQNDIQGGLVVIVVLWALIAFTAYAFYRVRPAAGYLLLPYLAWVSFATYLNYAFWVLN